MAATRGDFSVWMAAQQCDSASALEAGRRGVALFDRSSSDTVSLSGKDTLRFCNGMFSNNIRALRPGQSNQNVMLDAKGRILGQLEIWCVADATLLATLENVSSTTFMEHYDRFIIADDVELEDLSEQWLQLSLQGPGAAELLQRIGWPAPETGFVEVEGVKIARRRRSRAGGYDVLVPVEEAEAVAARLIGAGARVAGADIQEILRVEAGIARWPVDMGERALVHEMRMVPDYCSFEKGCYIGQEVINRIDVMGQVQKKLWGLELVEPAEDLPAAGSEVFFGEDAVGTTTSAVAEPGRHRVLAVLRKSVWKPGLELRVGPEGCAAVVRDLPFPEEGAA
jgi:tRNA-modifying protein YgfZ